MSEIEFSKLIDGQTYIVDNGETWVCCWNAETGRFDLWEDDAPIHPDEVIRLVTPAQAFSSPELQAENERITAEIHSVIEMIGHAIEFNERTAQNVNAVRMLNRQYRIIIGALGKALKGE